MFIQKCTFINLLLYTFHVNKCNISLNGIVTFKNTTLPRGFNTTQPIPRGANLPTKAILASAQCTTEMWIVTVNCSPAWIQRAWSSNGGSHYWNEVRSYNQMFLGKTSNWMLSVNYDEPSLGVVIIVLNCKSRYGALARLSFEPQARETMKTMTGTLGEVHFGVSMKWSKQRLTMVDLPVSWREQKYSQTLRIQYLCRGFFIVAILKLLLKSWIDDLNGSKSNRTCGLSPAKSPTWNPGKIPGKSWWTIFYGSKKCWFALEEKPKTTRTACISILSICYKNAEAEQFRAQRWPCCCAQWAFQNESWYPFIVVMHEL